ncbi:PREDICTED: 50S ribosomal protein L19-2, chloroplastic-like [Tarenaya hassleriana]|uniref:50S ribosomal protein L19-2, chloroplastic-like n=1 Tax=Tarenaya hassleriana TaxID=28532 RepID=UPI00053C857F|nr:PREDICTED: 50S ribosomal protein L19-2, chloroplastic-like [Tarenaya hassleriana]
MATSSHLLPQALHVIPRNPMPSSRNLGFSSFLSRGPTTNHRMSVSRGSGSNFGFSVDSRAKREFIVRAEENPEGEAEASMDVIAESETPEGEVEGNVEVEGEAAEAVAEEEKPPRKPRVKLGDIMGILNKRAIEASELERPVPDLRTGDIVEIKLEVPENRRRLSIYKGIVISKQNAGIHTTIRIRRMIAGVGVEIVFPIYSPNIKELKVVSHRKVRRARLYYLRDKLPRLSTFK